MVLDNFESVAGSPPQQENEDCFTRRWALYHRPASVTNQNYTPKLID